ncbi:MAG: iron-sulfur cluster carrier protein ApbC [Rhodobiaceae bacterium]|nr:iron-sulfur cluster carrier protein ApbC [Rhodobiaceae bacterium]
MASLDKESVLARLRTVHEPGAGQDIVSRGQVSDVLIDGSKIYFSIAIDPAQAEKLEPMRKEAETAVLALPGVTQVLASLTAHAAAGQARPARVPPELAARANRIEQSSKPGVPGVGAIIAVASGKGGVGKSTTAVNLALAFKANGLKVAVLDADIYGPSMPRLLGVSGQPEAVAGRVLKPLEGYGLKVMSMGFLVEEDTPTIWRGPMVISALTQMLREVAWGEIDVLVVDMPPGTGDAQLTMAQQVPLAGSIIVSTPQDLALIDARKGINMFRKVDVPILGIVENMSYFLCPKCGERSDVFGHGGARDEAERLGVEFLGEVPLEMRIRETSDSGKPVVATEPDSAYARIYRDIATKAWAQVMMAGEADGAPRIVIEG